MSTGRDIAALKSMTVGELRRRYEELFGEPWRSFNKQHLYRRCAGRIQALAEDDLSEWARRRAKELARYVDIYCLYGALVFSTGPGSSRLTIASSRSRRAGPRSVHQLS